MSTRRTKYATAEERLEARRAQGRDRQTRLRTRDAKQEAAGHRYELVRLTLADELHHQVAEAVAIGSASPVLLGACPEETQLRLILEFLAARCAGQPAETQERLTAELYDRCSSIGQLIREITTTTT